MKLKMGGKQGEVVLIDGWFLQLRWRDDST